MKNFAFGIGRALEVSRARISKAAALIVTGGSLCVALTGAQAVTFTGAGITFNDGATSPAAGTPYPGTINVSGLQNSIVNITLTLNGFVRSARPDDVDMLLVSPTGRTLIFFSDVGGNGTTSTGSLTITLSDAAAAFLPDAGPLASGTFRPTNESLQETTGNFPAPAPNGPYGSPGGSVGGTGGGPTGLGFATQFNFTNPNGTWSLYIVDDTNGTGGETGSITSWQLDIIAVPEPSTWLMVAGGLAVLLGIARARRGAGVIAA